MVRVLARVRKYPDRCWTALTTFGRRRTTRRIATVAGLLAVVVIGMVVGVLVAGRVTADVGPFRAQFALTPSFTAVPRSAFRRWARCTSTATPGRRTCRSGWTRSTSSARPRW